MAAASPAVREPTALDAMLARAVRERGPVLARSIAHSTATGYTRNATRPSWMASIKRLLVAWYNQEYGTSHDIDNINLTTLDADRCHRRSWMAIEEHLAEYLNGQRSEKSFREYVFELYQPFSDPKFVPASWLKQAMNHNVPTWYADAEFALNQLVGKRNLLATQKIPLVSVAEVVQYANDLGRHLFNAPGNLKLGHNATNQGIKEHFDPNVVNTPKGEHLQFTPYTRRALEHSPQHMKMDDESNFYSSQYTMRTDEESFNVGNLTPRSFDLALGL